VNRDDLARREADRAFVQRSLDDLESERAVGDLADPDYEALKAKYDSRLRVLDGEVAGGLAALPKRRPASLGRTVIRVGVIAALAVAAGVVVARSAGQRLPSDTVTGGNTRDANQLLVEARSALGTNRPAALLRFQQILEVQPDNAEARTYAAWIRRLDTKAAVDGGTLTPEAAKPVFVSADADFDRAASNQPGYADPRCFQAVMRFRDLSDPIKAHDAYAACLASNPNQLVAGLVSKLGPELETALAASEDPVISGLAKARIARDAKAIKDAIVLFDQVVALDPANAEARTWSVWLLANAVVTAQGAKQISDELAKSRLEKAETAIDAVVRDAPAYGDAACTKAVLALNRDDRAAATAALAVCRTGPASPEIRDTALRLAGP
jgi:tetratricopeptide (TPR) repeat protein